MLWAILPFSKSYNLMTILSFKADKSFSYTASISFSTSLSFDLALRSFIRRESDLAAITTPFMDGGALREASFTSPALSPKMARSSFSSGVG